MTYINANTKDPRLKPLIGHLHVFDLDTGLEVYRVVLVNTDEGWIVQYPSPFPGDDPFCTRIIGRFEIRYDDGTPFDGGL